MQIKDQHIVLYRLIIAILGWIMLSIHTIEGCAEGTLGACFGVYKAYTIQSNLLVIIWLTLVLIWGDYRPNPNMKRLKLLKGPVQTALTLYITITWLVFMTLLEVLYDPTGIHIFTNIIQHYVVPIAFIIDWAVTNRYVARWRDITYFLVFPVYYLIFTLINGAITGSYIYFFLDPSNGWGEFFLWVLALIVIFSGIGAIYVWISQKNHENGG